MRTQITRFECDAPDCDDVVDVPLPTDSPTVQFSAPANSTSSPGLPDGWVEMSVVGPLPDGTPRLVHASRPGCAAAMAKAQVADSVKAAEQRAAEEEKRRNLVEEGAAKAEAQMARDAKDAEDRGAAAVAQGEEQAEGAQGAEKS